VWIGLGGKSSDERLFEYLQERKSEFNAVFGASLNDNAEYVLIEEQLVGYFKNLAESDALGKIAHFYLADGAVWPFANFTPTKLNPDSNIEDCDD
jgi:hypothetical protein